MSNNQNKPIVRLVGQDGNAFAIIGACQKAARKTGWPTEKVNQVIGAMLQADSYDSVLCLACTHFEVE